MVSFPSNRTRKMSSQLSVQIIAQPGPGQKSPIRLTNRETREFTPELLPFLVDPCDVRKRRPTMRPCDERFQVTTPPLGHDLHRTVGAVPRVSREAQDTCLVGCRSTEHHALHPAVDTHADARAFGVHQTPRFGSISRNSASVRTRTPSSVALRSFDPGSAPATTKSVLRLTEEVTRPPAARIASS